MVSITALLWDVDGTIAETERDGHRVAFNLAFAASGLPWRWDEAHYGRLLRVAGGRERLLHDMTLRQDAPARLEDRAALARAVHARKNALYADIVRSGRIRPRPGVLELMRECREAGVRMGIATTTSRSNVTVLLAAVLGESWADWFDALVCGEDVQCKKPDPQVYATAVRQLDVPGSRVVALEDSPDGAAAACTAGLNVIVTRSCYFAHDPLPAVTAVGPGLEVTRGWCPAVPGPLKEGPVERVTLAAIQAWCDTA